MFIILQFCIIALVTIKLDALTTNQSFLLAAYYIKKCISPEIVAYDKLSKPLGNCPSTIGAYLDCLNNTKNYTTNYHPCPYIYFESGVIPVFCNNGSWGKVDYFSYCVPITDEEQIRRKYELYYKLGIISQWQYQYKLDADSNIPIIKQLSYYLYIIDAVVCFFGFIVLLLLIPLKNCRVMLHRNLIFSIMMRDISRLIHLHLDIHPIDYHTFIFKGCSYAFLVLQYFNLVEIFWMFNEGFFQFRQFFFVFITKSYMWVYFVVGWLVPAVITFGIYLPLMLKYSILKKFTLCWSGLNDLRIYYAIIVPIFIIVAANILMLWYLMWIIVSKLKSGTGSEFEKSRRAARSFLLLAFLLGGGFIFVNTGPNNCIPFQYIQVILIAPQVCRYGFYKHLHKNCFVRIIYLNISEWIVCAPIINNVYRVFLFAYFKFLLVKKCEVLQD
ncbi:corticotropin-releasing factor receptor 2 isoform X5 [Hydra vulgaris]|uniref:Corticotropin-releasing factor receptor 2 isoform X5 n=1 Tax=Hydra vulgaris TaxID=6087 RepID=A0ABM4CSV1_HYDVU